ncbi:MAG: hypothetical protein U5N86_10485 [Planctomycetota bacterium]|nr:hypothetical protein [Planctomycetota bacterium]
MAARSNGHGSDEFLGTLQMFEGEYKEGERTYLGAYNVSGNASLLWCACVCRLLFHLTEDTLDMPALEDTRAIYLRHASGKDAHRVISAILSAVQAIVEGDPDIPESPNNRIKRYLMDVRLAFGFDRQSPVRSIYRCELEQVYGICASGAANAIKRKYLTDPESPRYLFLMDDPLLFTAKLNEVLCDEHEGKGLTSTEFAEFLAAENRVYIAEPPAAIYIADDERLHIGRTLLYRALRKDAEIADDISVMYMQKLLSCLRHESGSCPFYALVEFAALHTSFYLLAFNGDEGLELASEYLELFPWLLFSANCRGGVMPKRQSYYDWVYLKLLFELRSNKLVNDE